VADLAELVRKAREGDVKAYARIFRQFQDMAVGYAFSLLGNFHEAEDAAQDAFVAAFQRLPQLRDPRAFPGWFRRVVFTYADRLRRRQHSTTSLKEHQLSDRDAEEPSVLAERREVRDRILAAVHALPEAEREATALFYINGYSSAQIGEFLEVPASTVRSRLQLARQRLKQEVVSMVKDKMEPHRPSRDESLAQRVCDFMAAAGHGSAKDFKALLSKQPQFAKTTGQHPYGWGYDVQALHVAAQWGQDEKVIMLLDSGVDINALDGYGCTALQAAILYRQPEIASQLIERRATVDIWAAAALGDEERVKAILAAKPDLVNSTDAYWRSTPLHWAGTVPVAKLLVKEGADPNTNDEHDNSPARWASGYYVIRPGVADYLTKKTGEGDIFMACALGQADEVARYLKEDPKLIEATIDGFDALSTVVIYPKFTPLHTAVFHRQLQIVRLLLDHGADVNSRPHGNYMPLHTAAAFGDVATAQILLEAGADLNAEDDIYHGTPRSWAQFWRQPEMMEFLAKQGGTGEVPGRED
jgi:RNA polymerase sigma factor (sigma-70 family)